MYTLPNFNLLCNIFTVQDFTAPPRVVSPCNLAFGRRTAMPTVGPDPVDTYGQGQGSICLLLPALTDIRDIANNTGPDGVECPAGSGRLYFVVAWDDIGKGFANEHRCAILTKYYTVAQPWPTPSP